MKTQRNILIAFILNLSFSIFEFFGGIYTGSVAIVSDAIHDVGDAASIGLSYFLEKKSKKQPDEIYTYGYGRYSVLGGLITTIVLLFGSVVMIYNSVDRLVNVKEINYDGMILFAIVGICVNFSAAFFTRNGDSLNQKAVNLHMLEDVLGWIVVLVGAVVMRFTDFAFIDPLMSIGVSVFIIVNSVRNLNEVANLFLERVPLNIDMIEIENHLKEIDGIFDVHHIHIWSMDGQNNLATIHIVTDDNTQQIKELVRQELYEHGINHVTIETETSSEKCAYMYCRMEASLKAAHGHHGHKH